MTSIIQLFLAFGYDSDYLTTFDNKDESYGIRNCKHAHMIRNRVTNISGHHNTVPMILYITFWSDDFEATQIKKNRNSIWIKTVTICPPEDQTTSPKYTYLLAMGRKQDNHDHVNDVICEEIKELAKCNQLFLLWEVQIEYSCSSTSTGYFSR